MGPFSRLLAAALVCFGLHAAPSATSASPAAGSAAAQTFRFSFSHSEGWQGLAVVNVLINNILDGRQACYVAFVASGPNSGAVYLVDNAGNAGGPYAGMLLPGSGSVANGQCTATASGSSVSGTGNELILTLSIAFRPEFAGDKVLYLAAGDGASNSGWQALGTWRVPGGGVTGPAVGGVSPARSSGSSESYTFTFTDPLGWQDLTVVNVLINSAINGVSACYVAFVPGGPNSGVVNLVDNSGNAAGPYAAVTLPGTGTASNGQCSIEGAGSRVSAGGNTLKLTLAIRFHASFSGNRVAYLAARSGTANSDWQSAGSVTVTEYAPWYGFGRDVEHTALSRAESQPLTRIRWQTPVDLDPQFRGTSLLTHYGSPLATAQNTVVIPVKTGATDGFRMEARNGADGRLLWTRTTDYILPPHDWGPQFGATLTPSSRVYFPGSGGTVYFRDQPDLPNGPEGQLAFYGIESYRQDPQSYNSSVFITTPITSDPDGNIFFGFRVLGTTPIALQSGIARIGADGLGTWMAASTLANDSGINQVLGNSAPALNPRLGLLYLAVSNGASGYLVALHAASLQTQARVFLTLPQTTNQAILFDNGTAAPTIGPDDDVYFGIFDLGSNRYRGWMLHFNSVLTQTKTPGAFGWDTTASIVPRSMVPGYTGASAYLLMTKYNDYAGAGGGGLNRIAILDPNATQIEAGTGISAMKEVLTLLGPTPSPGEEGVKEWCINTAAVDPATKSVLANSEDGKLYRWDLTTNTLSQSIVLTPGLGEAYTPTIIGADGAVYAINNATLFSVGR